MAIIMANKAIIKYNNEEIATVEENDSKILDCNGKYMNGNIEEIGRAHV